ncbi:MAG: hypothetical protein ABEH66_00925 [Halobacteriales archaeon]
MPFHTDTSMLLLAVGFGIPVGYEFPRLLKGVYAGDTVARTSDTEVSVDLAVLYATAILALSSILSVWPPEGQNYPPHLVDLVFYILVFISTVIIVRIGVLIVSLESK